MIHVRGDTNPSQDPTKGSPMARGSHRHDSLWKELLQDFFPQFLELFFPQIYADLDFKGHHHEFLDKEFQSIVRRSRTGRRYVDKLIKVYLRDGSETWVLIHIEVQGTEEAGFEQRLYIYHYLIFDRFRREVVTLAILADNTPRFRPETYETKRWGFSHTFTFPSVKLLDYRDRIAELEESANPFAIIVVAWLRMMESGKDNKQLYFWKRTLIKSLYCKG
jgi:hypothetical protein